jgi:hypothetical protein
VRNPSVDASRNGRDITFSWNAPAPNGRNITQMQIRIDGGNWRNVANNGSRTNTYAYSTRHTIDARAQDAAGQWSAVVSAAATTVDPPEPRAWVTKGASAQGQPGCSSSQCAYFVVNTQDFPAGNYSVGCNATGPYGGTPFVQGASRNIGANDRVQLGCYFGDDGAEVWVTIGGKAYERRTW